MQKRSSIFRLHQSPCLVAVPAILIIIVGCQGISSAPKQTSGGGSAVGQLAVAPSTMSFGNVSVGGNTIQRGKLTAGVSDITVSSAAGKGHGYSLSGISFPVTVPAGQSVPFTVTFAPQTAGSASGSIAFDSNATNSPTTETLIGSGSQQSGGTVAGELAVAPTTMSFGSVAVGSNSAQPGTLTAGSSDIKVLSAVWNGQGYSLSGISFPVTVPAGQSVPFTVTFAPQTAGNTPGSITFDSNATNSPTTETLTGSGTQQGGGTAAGQLAVAPTTMSFGNVAVGSNSVQQGTLTAGSSDIQVVSATWNGQGYSLGGIGFPVTVPAGQSVPFTVTFAPQTAGSTPGSIAFNSNATDSPTTETLTGNGTQQSQHSVALSWDASTSQVVGYNVYRGVASGGPYTKLNTSVDASTAYTDNFVQNGQTYYYVTTAVDSRNVESAYSNQVSASIP